MTRKEAELQQKYIGIIWCLICMILTLCRTNGGHTGHRTQDSHIFDQIFYFLFFSIFLFWLFVRFSFVPFEILIIVLLVFLTFYLYWARRAQQTRAFEWLQSKHNQNVHIEWKFRRKKIKLECVQHFSRKCHYRTFVSFVFATPVWAQTSKKYKLHRSTKSIVIQCASQSTHWLRQQFNLMYKLMLINYKTSFALNQSIINLRKKTIH